MTKFIGELVARDLTPFGISYKGFLCVYCQDLPEEYGKLAMILWRHKELRKYLGHRVSVNIINDFEKSIVVSSVQVFPQAVICGVEGSSDQELARTRADCRRFRRATTRSISEDRK